VSIKKISSFCFSLSLPLQCIRRAVAGSIPSHHFLFARLLHLLFDIFNVDVSTPGLGAFATRLHFFAHARAKRCKDGEKLIGRPVYFDFLDSYAADTVVQAMDTRSRAGSETSRVGSRVCQNYGKIARFQKRADWYAPTTVRINANV
jgi:hypothetical protein